jgi:uncharacterized protein involved in exopolysaccharide biosynthesis
LLWEIRMGPIHTLDDFLDMLRRRASVIARVILLGTILSFLWALGQDHRYRSSEVIQIEQPKVAHELAPSTVEGSTARRLQLIEQQLMARRNLIDVIEKFSLFSGTDLRPSEKVQRLREAVSITGVAAARQGYTDDGAISILTITAELGSGELAQAVAHEFADRTRALAATQRAEQTRDTLEFFTRKEETLLADMAALEAELLTFRRENDLSIEGSIEFRRDEIASLNAAILALDRDIVAAELARSQIDRSQRESTVARLESDYDAQVASLESQRERLEKRREQLNASLETSPEIERELANFERRMGQLQGQLEMITARRSEAEVGYALETADRGERLTTLEEAQVPDYPVSASRRKLAILGVAASVFAALGLAFALELRHPVIRSAQQMERETGLIPVVSIPEIKLPRQPRGLRRLWAARRSAGRAGRAARMLRNR